jgi:hypothetical protein
VGTAQRRHVSPFLYRLDGTGGCADVETDNPASDSIS